MPTDDFDNYVVTEPTRTRRGALKYQPPDADWSLDRLTELQDFYQTTYKRPLPITVKGQGSVHNRLGYDHRASADISLHPSTAEGRSLIAELQRRKIPFLAFEGAVPGASTGPHIHVGRPSSRIANKYPVGSQVKRTKQQQQSTPTDDFDSYVTADDDFDSYTVADKPSKATALPPIEEALANVQRAANTITSTVQRRTADRAKLGFGTSLPTAAVAAGVRDYEAGQRAQLAAAVDEYERQRSGSSNIGELRRVDEAAMAPYRATEAEVRLGRAFKRGIGMPVTLNPITAVQEYLAGEDATVRAETDARMQAGYAETERLREIASQFTDADRQQLTNVRHTLFGGSPVQRGVGTGTWKIGSGLLYKLAAISDLATSLDEPGKRSALGDYLRRKAAVGEIAINDLESELPPNLRQQLADFVSYSALAVPEMAVAVGVAGPVGGFAALGGLEAGGRKLPFSTVAKETAKGAAIGAVFSGAGAAESGLANRTFAQRAADTARSSVAIGLGTAATEKVFGATDEEALRAAAANVVFHVGMRVPGEVGRLAQAAERAYKTPPSEGGTPTVGPELQERLARAETPLRASTPLEMSPVGGMQSSLKESLPGLPEGEVRLPQGSLADYRPTAIESVPPAKPDTRPPPTAVPAVGAAATVPTAPSLERRSPTRIKDADWLELTPAERARVRQEVDAEQAAIGQTEAQPVAPRRPLVELMAERAEAGPTQPLPEPTIRELGPNRFVVEQETASGRITTEVKSREAADFLVRRMKQQQRIEGRRKGGEGGWVSVDEIAKAITKVREATTGKREKMVEYVLQMPNRQELAFTMTIDKKGVAHPFIGPAERTPSMEGVSADVTGVNKVNLGVDTLLALKRYLLQAHPEVKRVQFDRGGSTGFEVGRKVNLPTVRRTMPESLPMPATSRAVDLEVVRTELAQRGLEVREAEGAPIPTFSVMRSGREVAKFASTTRERALEQLDNYTKRLESEGGYIDLAEVVDAVKELRAKFPDRTERELRAMLPVTHRELLDREQPLSAAANQPRTDTGQFSPGVPGGPEAARSQLRSEARKYGQQYKALDLHQARRNGLDIVNDDVARNYFAALHRMAAEFLPRQAAAVDRAETLYNQGKYGQATMLAESVFRSLPDKVNEYAGADAAMRLVERGLTPKADWSRALQEVRERLKRTGGLSGGGSTFYDVNKHPEGGRPDHAKIAYILEPVIDALKADASHLIAAGKLKAADYTAHVRSEVNKMLQGPEFSDWHPLNKSAALGVLVDKLRRDGPPAAPSPAAQLPQQRNRSLPKTLEKSGRDPGTNLTHDRLPNAQVNERVEARLASEGADALETWYRNAPESADRTAAHRVLVDHYTAEAVKLADTAPETAAGLMLHARELSNLENERATTLGQAVQMYSNLLRYTPAGISREVASLHKKGAKIENADIIELTRAASQHQKLDKEVQRLERKVATLEAEEAGESAGAETRPRRYRPRPPSDRTVDTSKAEAARRQLDEAAKRRRAQKAFIDSQLRALAQQQTVAGYWKRSMNVTRGLMVSAFATAMRNLQTQALRFDIERLDDIVEHTIRRSVGLESDLTYRSILRNAGRQFRPGQTSEAKELLRGHEAEYWRMFNNYAGGVDVVIPTKARTAVERVFGTVERGVGAVNVFNRIQEHHIRSAEFLAELDLHLRKDHNQSLEQFVSRNGIDAIPLDTVRKAVDKALEVTFAGMPTTEGVGGRLITNMVEIGNYIPPTVSPVAFPRFMYNNAKFLYQHSPFGMLDLARKNQNRPRVIARSLVGTSLFLLAWQFRNSDHAGEKWYELKIGDTTLDARPFGPFSTYLFVAEAVRRGTTGEQQFTKDEITQVIGASPLGSGAGLELVDRLYTQISNGQWDKLQRTLKAEGGEWGRALLTPVRQVKDLVAAFDASQAVTRDTSSEPFLGPLKESIPYAGTDLPPAYKPTTATPIHQERPGTKIATGWRVITPKSFLEKQLDELNFKSSEILSSTGDREADAILKRVMGPLADELSRELENDAEFKRMSKAARGQYLREELSRIRSEARSLAEEENPELFDKLKEDRKPERQRKYEEELNSPGLSKAIELGVPMPIPPRRSDEDDIAYRARLLQVGRQRRQRLDGAINPSLSMGQQRATLHRALYS